MHYNPPTNFGTVSLKKSHVLYAVVEAENTDGSHEVGAIFIDENEAKAYCEENMCHGVTTLTINKDVEFNVTSFQRI